MSEVSAGYAQHSILIFPMMPSCPKRVQRVKRNPNLNSAEVLCAACFQESGINKKQKEMNIKNFSGIKKQTFTNECLFLTAQS